MYHLRRLLGNDVLLEASRAKHALEADAHRFNRWQCTPRILRPQIWEHKDGQPEKLALRGGKYRSPRQP